MAEVNGENVKRSTSVAHEGARSLLVMISGTLVVQTITLVAALVIPRFLGPEVYGRWSAVMALISFAATISLFSLRWVDLRFVGPPWRSGRIEEATQMASTTWLFRLVLGLPIAVLVAVWAYASPALEIDLPLAAAVFFVCVARSGLRTHLSLLLALGCTARFTEVNLARVSLIFAATVAGYALGGFAGIFLALAVALAFLFLLSLVLFRQILPVRPGLFTWAPLRTHWGFASWTFAGALCRSAQVSLPIYIVASSVSSVEAAFVGVQTQLLSVLTEVSNAGRNALLPILAHFDAEGQYARLRKWGSLIIRFGTAAGCLSVVIWALVGRELIQWILSDKYAPTYEGVMWIALAHTLLFAAATCNAVLSLRGLAKLTTINLAAYGLSTICGVLWTVRTSGDDVSVQVAMVFAAAAALFFVMAYFSLGMFGNCWLSLRRSLLLLAPALLAWPAQAWDASFAWRLVAAVGFSAAYLVLAMYCGLIKLDEMRNLALSAMRRVDRSEDEAPPTE